MELKILSIIAFASVANSSLAEDFIGRMDCAGSELSRAPFTPRP